MHDTCRRREPDNPRNRSWPWLLPVSSYWPVGTCAHLLTCTESGLAGTVSGLVRWLIHSPTVYVIPRGKPDVADCDGIHKVFVNRALAAP
jgi:hypothetical protein